MVPSVTPGFAGKPSTNLSLTFRELYKAEHKIIPSEKELIPFKNRARRNLIFYHEEVKKLSVDGEIMLGGTCR